MLSKTQIKYLRGICHHIQPVVMLGAKGMTENVMHEVELALEQHELIKVKLRTDRETRKQLVEQICKDRNCEAVQVIGQVACFYRPAKKPELELPR